MRILQRDKTSAELSYTRDPDAGSYELFVLNPNFARRSIFCSNDKCSLTSMQPGTTYTILPGTCSSAYPVRCIGRAKPLVITSLPDGKCSIVALLLYFLSQSCTYLFTLMRRSRCCNSIERRHHQFHGRDHASRRKSCNSIL